MVDAPVGGVGEVDTHLSRINMMISNGVDLKGTKLTSAYLNFLTCTSGCDAIRRISKVDDRRVDERIFAGATGGKMHNLTPRSVTLQYLWLIRQER